ncbi:hypothetical protein BDW71DRAFT_24722 [Aspergillus fruticulosus]
MRPLSGYCEMAVTLILVLVSWVLGEPVQYCRYGHSYSADATVDFCLAVTTFYNVSSNDHDVYVSMQVTRSSALGWTALGTGSMMAGSLMFIVYGDPFSSKHEAPTVSIRTIDSHYQPQVLSQVDTGGVDIRLLHANWVPGDTTELDDSRSNTSSGGSISFAKVAIVCYSCGKWSGSPISAGTTAQPWIWAWNNQQEFDAYTDDIHLSVHQHHAETGGWGRFYIDMARSASKGTSPPPLPPIRPGITALGASDIPGGWSWIDSIVRFHGFIMSAAFLIFFPAGVVAMRSESSKSFKYHWVLQLFASVLVLVGVAIGLIRAHKMSSPHHYMGIIVALLGLVQITLGWRHHIVFVRIQRRHWASHVHIWLGRLFLLLGWANVITGLRLTGRGWSLISLAVSSISIAAVTLSGWVWFATRQRRQHEHPHDREVGSSLYDLRRTRDDYFAVVMDDDDESESGPSGGSSEPVKIRKSDAK